jgi:hypothetical protein
MAGSDDLVNRNPKPAIVRTMSKGTASMAARRISRFLERNALHPRTFLSSTKEARMRTDARTEAIATKIAIQKLTEHDEVETVDTGVDEGKVFARRSAVLKPAGGHVRRKQSPQEREVIITLALTDPDLDS